MRCLVTGGAGFIGSNLVEGLVEAGHDVIVLDNLSLGKRENLSEVMKDIRFFVEGDIKNSDLINKVSKGVDCIFHHAGLSSSMLIQTDKEMDDASLTNVIVFRNILEAACENNVKRVIYASSSQIYGNCSSPFREDMKANPLNYYALTISLQEATAGFYSQEYGLDTVGLRYMSIYGPHEEHKYNYRGSYANLVSQFLWAMRKGEKPSIYGNGTQTRDFTYIRDAVKANLLVMNSDEKFMGEVFNVGTGKTTDLNELVKILNDILGTNISPEYVENPIRNYMVSQCADISKIKKKLGFEPEYDLMSGILAMISGKQS